MKNEKILSWLISILLMCLIFAEALIRYFVDLKELPFALASQFILYFNSFGFWVRLGVFATLWVFSYSTRKQTLAEKYAILPRKTMSNKAIKNLIFAYILCGFIGLFIIYLPFPWLIFLVYFSVFILGFLFSYLPEKELERVQTDRKKNTTKFSLHLKWIFRNKLTPISVQTDPPF